MVATDVHRLRDLDRNQRIFALALGIALALAPLVALVHYGPHWFPSGDPALMGLRSLDVGTGRTTLTGQPSLSFTYVDGGAVNHLGGVHFYLMAPFVHVLGVRLGMLVVSVLITCGCLLVAGWVGFRQLGPAGGAITAVVLGAVSFTTGASALVNPVSSNIAGYPFLLSAFLVWALVCGDLRLLPLAAAVVSFTALQHLSVLPSLAVLVALGGALAVWLVVVPRARASAEERRRLLPWIGGAAVAALALWLPVLVQNVAGNAPNLDALVRFSGSSQRPKLGYGMAVRHVVHAVGLPPALGQTDLMGDWLFTRPAPGTWLSAAAVLGLVGYVTWRWRTTHPQRARLGMMTLVLVVAGLVGSATVPAGHEERRLVFYWWVFPLVGSIAIIVGLIGRDLVGRLLARRQLTDRARPLIFGAAIAAVAVPALVNPHLDRWSNSSYAAYAPFDDAVLDDLADQVLAHRDELDGDGRTVLMSRKPAFDVGIDSALNLTLEQRGLRLSYPSYQYTFVDDEWMVDPDEVTQGLVLVLDSPVYGIDPPPPPPGEVIAEEEIPTGFSYFAHWDHKLANPEQATLRVYLLDRDDLLDWTTSRELAGQPDPPSSDEDDEPADQS
jgi:hypothetical protein